MKRSVCCLNVKGCANFGLTKFLEAAKEAKLELEFLNHWCEQKNPDAYTVVIGTVQDLRVEVLLRSHGEEVVRTPESTVCKWLDTRSGRVLLIAGSDYRGLMYNLLEFARKIRRKGCAGLDQAADLMEKPQNAVRCMDRYIVGHLDNEWFLSEEFWDYYLDRLASNRFNRFCLIVGFDTAYMAPPYPFFMVTKGYENVYVRHFTVEQREANLTGLRRIVDACHAHGMDFVLATWQQRPWTDEQERLVENLPESETDLMYYCYAGLKQLLEAVPEIDAVQFRVNHESGVGTQVSAADFWNRCADAVADAGKALGKQFTLDLRAKGLTEEMVDHAFAQGLKVEVPTKYWCEHAALPYHISVMRSEELRQLDNYNHSRRYSYANMLEKPKKYNVIYRLWNYGSTNLFLWGDADYARRFSKSCGLSGSAGFEVNSPLSLKYGHELSHREAWRTFADPTLRYGKWEDERFWMWYTVFGRLGYNPDTDPEVWQSEFSARFGEKAYLHAERALALASRIVPLVTAFHMPVHPSLRYWTEMSTGWALFPENNLDKLADYARPNEDDLTYGSSEPSDHGLFYGIDEFAKEGKCPAGKYTPLQYAKWLLDLANELQDAMERLEADGTGGKDAEYKAMTADFRLLIFFARYHAYKVRSALALAYYNDRHEPKRLADAVYWFDLCMREWKGLSDLGRKVYYHDLDFSSAGTVTRRGTWGDLMPELGADRAILEKLLQKEKLQETGRPSFCYEPGRQAVMTGRFPAKAEKGKAIRIEVGVSGITGTEKLPVLHYRNTDQTEGLFHRIRMQWDTQRYYAEIPASYVTGRWDILVYVTLQGPEESCTVFPGVNHPDYPYPYHVIEVE